MGAIILSVKSETTRRRIWGLINSCLTHSNMAAFGTGNAAVQCRNPSRAVDKQYEQEVCAPGKRKKMEVNETGKWDASALKVIYSILNFSCSFFGGNRRGE